MQPRNLFLLLFFAIVFVMVAGALIANSNGDAQDATLVVTQETPLQDGASLLNSRCARCHTVELIKQTVQTRAEWENTVVKMETMGAILSNDEKIVLVDYLTSIDKP